MKTSSFHKVIDQYNKSLSKLVYEKKLNAIFKDNFNQFFGYNKIVPASVTIERWDCKLEDLGCQVSPLFKVKKDHHRIEHPARNCYIFVPKELTQKILVLGGLP